MQRDKFTCKNCDAADKTLNVHHCFYEWGRDPWDYPLASLVTLCEECHSNEDREIVKKSQSHLIRALAERGFTAMDFDMLALAISLEVSA